MDLDPYDRDKTREIWKRVLGEAECTCGADAARLRDWIAKERESAAVLAAWARRMGCDTLCRMSREALCRSRKLETVWFLLTGEHADVCPARAEAYSCAAEMLRAMHAAALASGTAYRQAAEEWAEYRAVFSCLAEESRRQAACLFALLQRCIA